MVLPGSAKSFDQFRFDDNECRQYSSQSIGGTTVADAQNSSAVKSAAVGTAIGAAADRSTAAATRQPATSSGKSAAAAG